MSKESRAAYQREYRRTHEAYRARHIETTRQWRAANPGRKVSEARRAQQKQYYQDHKEQIAAKYDVYRRTERGRALASARRKRWYLRNRERCIQAAKDYVASHPRPPLTQEQRDGRNQATKRYKAAHPDKVRAGYRDWVAAHREQRRETGNNGAAVYRARKRASQFDIPIRVESVTRRVIWERDAGICHLCNMPADPNDWHIEHVIPLSKGGDHAYSNVAVSHPQCNLRKGTR